MASSGDDLARDTYLDLVRVHEALSAEFAALFRRYGLTQSQYNVLRILRGAPDAGVSCQYIGERLLNRVPDVTRLLDRMEAAGHVLRARSEEDRRVVRVRLTAAGSRLCGRLDRPVAELHRQQFAHLSGKALAALGAGLRQVLAKT